MDVKSLLKGLESCLKLNSSIYVKHVGKNLEEVNYSRGFVKAFNELASK
jgi:hypothetical protein